MCHYSHCRGLGQTGKEKEGVEERKERQNKKGGQNGWMQVFRDKRWNKWTDAAKEGRRGFTVDRLRRAELGKSLKMSQTCDSRLLNFMECCLSVVPPLLAFAKCGWSLQWYTQRLQFYVALRPFLQATGFLFCPTPGVFPCGDEALWLCCIQPSYYWTAPFVHHMSAFKM